MEGKKAYSQHMWLLRFHSSLFFSRCEVNALHMTCSDQPQAMQASVRLRMQRLWGVPLHNLIEDPWLSMQHTLLPACQVSLI